MTGLTPQKNADMKCVPTFIRIISEGSLNFLLNGISHHGAHRSQIKTTNVHSWGRGKIHSLTVIEGNFKSAVYLIDDTVV